MKHEEAEGWLQIGPSFQWQKCQQQEWLWYALSTENTDLEEEICLTFSFCTEEEIVRLHWFKLYKLLQGRPPDKKGKLSRGISPKTEECIAFCLKNW